MIMMRKMMIKLGKIWFCLETKNLREFLNWLRKSSYKNKLNHHIKIDQPSNNLSINLRMKLLLITLLVISEESAIISDIVLSFVCFFAKLKLTFLWQKRLLNWWSVLLLFKRMTLSSLHTSTDLLGKLNHPCKVHRYPS